MAKLSATFDSDSLNIFKREQEERKQKLRKSNMPSDSINSIKVVQTQSTISPPPIQRRSQGKTTEYSRSSDNLPKKRINPSRSLKNKQEFLPVKFQTGIDFMLMDSVLKVKSATAEKLVMLLTFNCVIG